MARPRDARRDRRAAVSGRTLARTGARRPMKRLESKLPAVGTTIFTVMTQLANEHGAVNLSQGFPNFEPPTGLIERVEHYLGTRCHQYAPMPGSVTAARRDRREARRALRRDGESGHRDHGHERRDRGDLLRDPGRRAPRRRGDRARSVLRLVRAVGHARGRARSSTSRCRRRRSRSTGSALRPRSRSARGS